MKKILLLFIWLPTALFAQIDFSNNTKSPQDQFAIVEEKSTATIVINNEENILIQKSANFFADDVEKVSGSKPLVHSVNEELPKNIIIIGTIGNNKLIEELINSKKLNVDEIKGEWERFVIKTIKNPFKGVDQALIVVGSDRRGAAYGVFTLSEKMGVSPWYWWADVPVVKSENIYLQNIHYVSDGPSV